MTVFSVLDIGLFFTASLGPRAPTKVESHASFMESKKVSQMTIFYLFIFFLQCLTLRS